MKVSAWETHPLFLSPITAEISIEKLRSFRCHGSLLVFCVKSLSDFYELRFTSNEIRFPLRDSQLGRTRPQILYPDFVLTQCPLFGQSAKEQRCAESIGMKF